MTQSHSQRPRASRHADPTRAPVQLRARAEERSRGQSIDDFMVSLTAPAVQLEAFDQAVSDVHGALARRAPADVQRSARAGLAGGARPLPHLERIQEAFGPAHDLSGVQAHVGGPATAACDDMHANAYATGQDVAFAASPSLELAAHEAAHVVQQRAGAVQLSGGVGRSGDRYEQHADRVAARVAAGRSAADLLPTAPSSGGAAGVQLDEKADAPAQVDAPAAAPASEAAAGRAAADPGGPPAFDDERKAKINALTLQELKYLKERLDKRIQQAKDTQAPEDALLKQVKTYVDARELALAGELHSGAGASTGGDERKRHLGALGTQVSGGKSFETGTAQKSSASDLIGPKEGERVVVNKTVIEGVEKTVTQTRSGSGASGQTVEANTTVTAEKQNDKAKEKTSRTDERSTTTRDGDNVKTTTRSATTDSTGGQKDSLKTTEVGGGKTTVTETKRESADLNEARKAKEKKDEDERKKLGLSPTTATNVKLASGEASVAAGQDRKVKGKTDLGHGVSGTGEAELATAEAKATADAAWDPSKGLVVTGGVSAKATAVSGGYKFEAGPYDFSLGGEALRATFSVGVSAAVVAEASGALSVNIAKSANKVGIELTQPKTAAVGAGGKAAAFAGGKVAADIGAKLEWKKSTSYAQHMRELGKRYISSWLARALPDSWIDSLANVVYGSGGVTTIAAVKAGLEGTSGIGGEIGGGIAFAGGRISVSGKFQGTLGLGAGTNIKADIDAIDGMRLLVILIANGPQVLEDFGMAGEKVWAFAKEKALAAWNSSGSETKYPSRPKSEEQKAYDRAGRSSRR
ncbi:MAG: DUF4157 domain-containing protein [Myxococcota bacterium]